MNGRAHLRRRLVQKAPQSAAKTIGMYARAARLLLAAFALIGAGAGFAGPAMALEPGSLRDFLFGPSHSAALPAVARYEFEDGGSSFVLDTSGRGAYLKFEGSGEIWALHPTPGPRGDVIYKNDIDEPVVRATHLGGVTVFTHDQPEGMPAAFMGQAAPPRMNLDIGPEALWNIFVQASARASHMAEHLVVFEGPQDVTAATAPIFADAAILTSQAFLKVGARGKSGRTLVARFLKVEFDAGKGAAATTRGQVVKITVCPDQGVAGRPSSQRIASVISR
jgi:hypothetical protein